MKTTAITGLAALAALFTLSSGRRRGRTRTRVPGPVGEGTLLAFDKQGQPAIECPLKHTDVKADITGFLARVTVTQEFHNTATDRVEAVYVFPAGHGRCRHDGHVRR